VKAGTYIWETGRDVPHTCTHVSVSASLFTTGLEWAKNGSQLLNCSKDKIYYVTRKRIG
jgi:hypothetical protein